MAATEETTERRRAHTTVNVHGIRPEDVNIVAHQDRYWVEVEGAAGLFPEVGTERDQLERIRAIGQRLVEDADMHLAMLPREGEG